MNGSEVLVNSMKPMKNGPNQKVINIDQMKSAPIIVHAFNIDIRILQQILHLTVAGTLFETLAGLISLPSYWVQ